MAIDYKDLPNAFAANPMDWGGNIKTAWENWKLARLTSQKQYYTSTIKSGVTFATWISDIGDEAATVWVNSVVSIPTNQTIPDNISVEVLKGGSFAGSAALTFDGGSFEAGDYQVFTSTLTVSGLRRGRVAWFGAVGDGVTDDVAAIHRALAACVHVYAPATPNGYLTSTAITIPGGGTLYGDSLGAQKGGTKIVKAAGNYTSFFTSDDTQSSFEGWSVKHFTLSGGTSTTWSDVSGKWAVKTHYPFSHIENILAEPASGFIGNGFKFHNDNSATNGGSMGCWQSVIKGCRFVGCVVTAPTNNDQIGIDLYVNGGAVKVINTSVNRTDVGAWIRKGENIAFDNVNLENMPTGSAAGKTRAAMIIGEDGSNDLIKGFDFKGYVEAVGRGFLIQNAWGVRIHDSYLNTIRAYDKTGGPDGFFYIKKTAAGVSIDTNQVEDHYSVQTFIYSEYPYYESVNNVYFRNRTSAAGVPQTYFGDGPYSPATGSQPSRTNDLVILLDDTCATAAIVGITNVGGAFNLEVTAHGKASGDWVWVEGATNYSSLHRFWQITRVDADNFTLDGSEFAGSGAVSGNVWWPSYTHYHNQATALTPNFIPKKAPTGTPGFVDSTIEDNGTNIKLGRNIIINGASVQRVLRSIDTDQLIISGGTDGGNASKLTLVGGTHASQAGDIALESFATIVLSYDQSAALWTLLGDLKLNTSAAGLILQTGAKVVSGSGSPESAVTASAGSMYLNTSGDLYVKASGSGNTGWSLLAFLAAPTFTGHVKRSATTGITASTTQTQGQQALTTDINIVSTCANANDVVTLPAAVAGMVIYIRNNGAQTLQIFPASGDNINGTGVDASVTLVAGASVTYRTADVTNWYS
jgi:hypothetical protein